MDILHGVALEAPTFRTFRDDKSTLLMSWWCTIYSLVVILTRVFGRYVRTEKSYKEDALVTIGIIPLLIRQAFVHVVLLYGTNNTTFPSPPSDTVISQRELGSKLVLLARIFYAAYLWSLKFSTSVFLNQLTTSTSTNGNRHERVFKIFNGLLVVSFLGVVVSILAPCQPFSKLWQVTPDPGAQCRSGYAFTITNGILNGVTNTALVIFPLPTVWLSKLGGWKKLSITIRLGLPLLTVAFTIYQTIIIIPTSSRPNANNQAHRTLLASIDILWSTFIVNAVVLISLTRDRGFKKSKWKWEVISTGEEAWGSGGRVRKVQVGWDATQRDWKNDVRIIAGKAVESGGGSRSGKWSKKSSLEGSDGSRDESYEMRGLRKGEDGVRMEGVERPERARLLGEIRVAKEWEVSTSR